MTAASRNVRLKDANPTVNPGWMTPEQWDKEVRKNPKDLNRKVKIIVKTGD